MPRWQSSVKLHQQYSQSTAEFHTSAVLNSVRPAEYEVWAMKMEYWITNNDMNIWKVIQNGNSLKRTGRDVMEASLYIISSIEILSFQFPVNLQLFPNHGEARDWLDKEPPRSILTWDDLVSKFINQYFPPSKTTYYRNEIITFYQKPNEAFNEAWERFKGLLRQCPHHGFSELHQLDTFYNSLNSNDQDALDSAAGGNFLDKMPQEGRKAHLLEEQANPSVGSKVRYSRSRANDSRVSMDAPLSNSSPSNNSFDMQQIAASLEDKMTIKMNQMMNEMKAFVVTTPAPVKAVEEVLCLGSCKTSCRSPLRQPHQGFGAAAWGIVSPSSWHRSLAPSTYILRSHQSRLKKDSRLRIWGRLRRMSPEKAWTTIEELAQYEDEGWNNPIFLEEESLDYKNPNIKQLLGVMKSKVDMLMENAISLMGKMEDVCDMMHQLQLKPSRQEAFKDLMMNFIHDQEEKVKKLKEYMCVIGSDFMQLSSEVIERLKEEIRIKENEVKKIEKITRYPDTEDLGPLNGHEFSEAVTRNSSSHTPKFVSPKSLCVKHVRTIFPSPPLVRESTFGFKPDTKNNRNVKSRHDAKNSNPQSTPQVLPSFEENTPPATYPDEVEEII
ncbi:reverse transcriptase domain-containing protein [Tanacetum coccineum]